MSGGSSTSKPPSIRRIVTGHGPHGASTAIFNDEITTQEMDPSNDAVHLGRIWLTEESPAKNSDSTTDKRNNHFTERFGLIKTGGSHCVTTDLAPGGRAPMHRTHSVDYNILISGTLTHVLADGTEHTFSEPGSIIVQRGTEHAWENRSEGWAKWISILIDAEPVEVVDENDMKSIPPEAFQGL